MRTRCKNCDEKIRMMCRKGTRFCSERCLEDYQEKSKKGGGS